MPVQLNVIGISGGTGTGTPASPRTRISNRRDAPEHHDGTPVPRHVEATRRAVSGPGTSDRVPALVQSLKRRCRPYDEDVCVVVPAFPSSPARTRFAQQAGARVRHVQSRVPDQDRRSPASASPPAAHERSGNRGVAAGPAENVLKTLNTAPLPGNAQNDAAQHPTKVQPDAHVLLRQFKRSVSHQVLTVIELQSPVSM